MTSWERTKPLEKSLLATIPQAPSSGTGLTCSPTLAAPLPNGTPWNLKKRWMQLLGKTNRQLHFPTSPNEHSKWSRAINTSVRQHLVFVLFSKLQHSFFDGCEGIRVNSRVSRRKWFKSMVVPSFHILPSSWFAACSTISLCYSLQVYSKLFTWVFLRPPQITAQNSFAFACFGSFLLKWDLVLQDDTRACKCEITRDTVLAFEEKKKKQGVWKGTPAKRCSVRFGHKPSIRNIQEKQYWHWDISEDVDGWWINSL